MVLVTGEDDGPAAVPLFLSLRAAIRAHVTAAAMDHVPGAERRPQSAIEARRHRFCNLYPHARLPSTITGRLTNTHERGSVSPRKGVPSSKHLKAKRRLVPR
jgi:hypothetical protein